MTAIPKYAGRSFWEEQKHPRNWTADANVIDAEFTVIENDVPALVDQSDDANRPQATVAGDGE